MENKLLQERIDYLENEFIVVQARKIRKLEERIEKLEKQINNSIVSEMELEQNFWEFQNEINQKLINILYEKGFFNTDEWNNLDNKNWSLQQFSKGD